MTGIVGLPAIAIDPTDGSVWIAFVHWRCAECAPSGSAGIFVINNVAGTWSEPVRRGSDGAVSPSLAVRDGRVSLAYELPGDYGHRFGPVMFGTDAPGAWEVQQLVQAGTMPHLVLDADGQVEVLVVGDNSMRYAYQKPNGSFVVERLPGTTGVVGPFWNSRLAVDAVSGDTWAAWTANRTIFVATRGVAGWPDPITAILDGDLIGLGVRDGVIQLAADKSGVTYASSASGTFLEQVIASPSNFYWGDAAFALLPTGRPIVVIARDIPSDQSGMWFLKGPAV